MWVKNCWYVIAWDHEIPAADSPEIFTRTVLNQPIIVIRKSDGNFSALEDRCCHRHAPLSKGRREGDCVRCGYHGMKFDANGVCVEVPSMDKPPSKAKVKEFPVAFKNNWIFVWMGDPARADEKYLPDNFSCKDPNWKNIPGYLHYDTPYLLISDNLLDFSHLSYVHEKTLGGSTAIAHARPEIEVIDENGQRGIRVTRHVPNVPPPPYYQKFRPFDTNIDRWFIYDFLLPSTLLMKSGGKPIKDADGDMTNAVQLHSCQTLTPETENSTHYFFQQSHQANLGDEEVTKAIYKSLEVAFEEDRDMITAQHKNMAFPTEMPMTPLHFDVALLQFRKIVEQEAAKD